MNHRSEKQSTLINNGLISGRARAHFTCLCGSRRAAGSPHFGRCVHSHYWLNRILKLDIGRLGKEATDYIMLFLAPAFVTRPQLTPSRWEILTTLWCIYTRKTLRMNDDALGRLEEGTEPKTTIEKEQTGDVEEEQRTRDIEENQREDTEKGQKRLDVKESKKLLEWFALALFGRHVRLHEAQAWRERCGRYLEVKKGEDELGL